MDEVELELILTNYGFDHMEGLTFLGEGYYRKNYLLNTGGGTYVLKIMDENTKNPVFAFKVLEKLYSKGQKVAKPIKNYNGELVTYMGDAVAAVQHHVPGSPIENPARSDLKLLGEKFGELHNTLEEIDVGGKGHLDSMAEFKMLSEEYVPNNSYITGKVSEMRKKIDSLPLGSFTEGIIHGDCGLEDFFFKNGKLTGILDFGNSRNDFFLYDLATTITYLSIENEEKNLETFLNSYKKVFNISEEEISYLGFFITQRILDQVLFHNYRYEEDLSKGIEEVEDNLKILRHYTRRLKGMEEKINSLPRL
ncbi:MAG: phosphotransferase [Candidatus Nanohaloarchaea archaeon]|nr:phosphotransferase [Candidatus Nanohaloarchaea archaeon]